MAVQAHIGDHGVARVIMTDAQGNETSEYDVAGGIQWTSSAPDAISVVDDDAKPEDVAVEFLALTDTEQFIECMFDGDTGDGVREIRLRSEPILVVPGEATGGTVEVTMTVV